MLRIRTFGKVSIEIPFSEASVGDILCSDNKIVSTANYAISGKMAIGIVVHNSNGVVRVMALTAPTTAQWGGFGLDLPTSNIETQQDAIADIDGAGNTEIMYHNIPDSTIVVWVSYYDTPGAPAGTWYMPASGEVYMIGQGFAAINSARAAIGLSALPSSGLVILSSTERDSENIWYGHMMGGVFTLYGDLAKNIASYTTYPMLKKTY